MAIVDAGASAVLLDEDSGLGRGWLRHVELVMPVVLLVLVVGACFVWPLIGPVPGPTGGDVLSSNLPSFSPGHLLGTDPNGNDVWARLLYGGRSSLIVGLSVNALGLVVGGTLGAVSAYTGGILDAAIMRVLDVLIAFPSLVLTLAVAQSLGPSRLNTILALAFFSVPAFARISRAATLRLREQPFMVAADLCGTRTSRMLFRHIAPNILPQLVTFAMLGMGIVIVIEGALSFLGLGIPAPAPSWGNMIAQGQQSLSATPMLVVWPCLMLFLTVLAFNLLGETLRSRWSGR
ncbi:peptide/nickel transport system permease protein [Amycolatopsis bartoniae]|uniref:Diguanylate cyclase n=1 Tax=Amycolatopsis bartoniae TaxID=941986 RepID=A0A8H9M9J0_9PSEU|nr:ABC transporter permease [Amycolatopsis bartoniae]MBB2936720.1 peptide/nickel transport system permease protein [Amycolatopsis bartoniae]TVT09224.1 ABC transporter permease [Amycolatopsis bartoniae]GHF49693.1 diguanylate cyclase [Amycolatopsis bartoniae]